MKAPVALASLSDHDNHMPISYSARNCRASGHWIVKARVPGGHRTSPAGWLTMKPDGTWEPSSSTLEPENYINFTIIEPVTNHHLDHPANRIAAR